MPDTTRNAQHLLDVLIDKHGLRLVLELLSLVCHEKADHLRSSWQDDRTARTWEHDAKRIDACAAKVGV